MDGEGAGNGGDDSGNELQDLNDSFPIDFHNEYDNKGYQNILTELSEVKLEVIMEVKGEVKGTIPHEQTASKAIVQPVSLA